MKHNQQLSFCVLLHLKFVLSLCINVYDCKHTSRSLRCRDPTGMQQRTLEFDSCRPLVTQLFNIACELQGMLYCFVACETEIEISFMCGQLASC